MDWGAQRKPEGHGAQIFVPAGRKISKRTDVEIRRWDFPPQAPVTPKKLGLGSVRGHATTSPRIGRMPREDGSADTVPPPVAACRHPKTTWKGLPGIIKV